MSEDLTGRTFGKWLVLEKSDRPYYYKCECLGCGAVKDVWGSSLRLGKSKSCIECTHKEKAAEKVGQEINGWKILEITGAKRKNIYCMAICPKCKKPSEVILSRLKYIKMCADCSRDIGTKTGALKNAFSDGSCLRSVKNRMGGRVNENSATGVNGVSFMRNAGKYRVYINFKRKQYYLGMYDTLEEAAAARKEAENLIYKPYLEENAGWEERVKEALNALNK